MVSRQLPIPGLEELRETRNNADKKHAAFQEELKALQDRLLWLELEVSLLQIRMEKSRSNSS